MSGFHCPTEISKAVHEEIYVAAEKEQPTASFSSDDFDEEMHIRKLHGVYPCMPEGIAEEILPVLKHRNSRRKSAISTALEEQCEIRLASYEYIRTHLTDYENTLQKYLRGYHVDVARLITFTSVYDFLMEIVDSWCGIENSECITTSNWQVGSTRQLGTSQPVGSLEEENILCQALYNEALANRSQRPVRRAVLKATELRKHCREQRAASLQQLREEALGGKVRPPRRKAAIAADEIRIREEAAGYEAASKRRAKRHSLKQHRIQSSRIEKRQPNSSSQNHPNFTKDALTARINSSAQRKGLERALGNLGLNNAPTAPTDSLSILLSLERAASIVGQAQAAEIMQDVKQDLLTPGHIAQLQGQRQHLAAALRTEEQRLQQVAQLSGTEAALKEQDLKIAEAEERIAMRREMRRQEKAQARREYVTIASFGAGILAGRKSRERKEEGLGRVGTEMNGVETSVMVGAEGMDVEML